MACPHCASTTTSECPTRTQLGYRTFHCVRCRRTGNERTGTPFNFLTFPSDIVLQVVLWWLRYKLSLRDLAEVFLERGFLVTYEGVREWKTRGAPLSPISFVPNAKVREAVPGTSMNGTSR